MTTTEDVDAALDKLRYTIDAVPDITKLRASHAQLLEVTQRALWFLAGEDCMSGQQIIARLKAAIAKAEELAP